MRKLISITGALAIALCAISAWAAPFTATNPMTTGRDFHTANLLPNGKVLLAGGDSGSTAEVYDPSTGSFTAIAGNMTFARRSHTATLLPNGTVLIAGGYNGNALNTAEIYDPSTGTFTATAGNLTGARYSHTATLLPNGRVLIAGGTTTGNNSLNTAEVYDPTTGTFTATTGNMTSARSIHTATLLPNGTVLIAGGYTGSPFLTTWNTAELYDPATGIFTATAGNMTSARGTHTATLLMNGKVLLAGGYSFGNLTTAELFDPATETFTATDGTMLLSDNGHTATLLPNGKVLITHDTSITAELFDPANNTFAAAEGNATIPRLGNTATLLPNGKVLIAGGSGYGASNTAEEYDYAFGTFTATWGNIVSSTYHTATLLPNGKVLITGGMFPIPEAEVYDYTTGTFTATTGNMTSTRYSPTATLLPNGKVLIAGGYGYATDGWLNSAELYDPATDTFTATAGNMIAGRVYHTATLLPNGKVLIAGGYYYDGNNDSSLNTAELYDSATDTFKATSANMIWGRASHTATLLPNGKVLLAGGYEYANSSRTNTAELYDPATDTFTATTGNMTAARDIATATQLPNGKVLIAGGYNGTVAGLGTWNTAELYNPTTGTFSALTSTMTSSRGSQTAVLLLNGKVLISGGDGGYGNLNTAELYDPATETFTATAGNMLYGADEHTAALLPDGKVLIVTLRPDGQVYDADFGFSDTWRPNVDPISASIIIGQSLSLTGSGFSGYGNAEGSGGMTNNSATNFPLVMLRSMESGQTLWIETAHITNGFTAASLTTMPVDNFPAGPSLLTVFVNGIPSVAGYVTVIAAPIPDTTPDPFSFTTQTEVPLKTLVTSNIITVSGINMPSPISITGGQYSVNNGAFTATVGIVNDGDTVKLQLTSAGSYAAMTSATLTIGGVSGTFSVTTLEYKFTFAVRAAIIKWWNKGQTSGLVAMTADFVGPIPASGDIVSVSLDGIQLFTAHFSEFKKGSQPGVYMLTRGNLLVRLDFTSKRLFVGTPVINLVNLNANDGVSVQMTVGAAAMSQTILMNKAPLNSLIYRRPGIVNEP